MCSDTRSLKGQGATEYLALLAAVLLIALVVLALLSFFPGLSSDAQATQSQAYWQGEASPFSIVDSNVMSDGGVVLVLQNKDASGTFLITNVSLASSAGFGAGVINGGISPGEKETVAIVTTAYGAAGTGYELGVNISYVTPDGLSKVEYGSKPLIGKYAPSSCPSYNPSANPCAVGHYITVQCCEGMCGNFALCNFSQSCGVDPVTGNARCQ